MSRRTALLDLMLRTLVPAALSPICLVRRTLTRQTLAPFLLMLVLTSASLSAAEKSLPGTEPLSVEQPLDELMLDGLHRFCQKELQAARIRRQAAWSGPIADRQAESNRIEQLRQRLRICIGAVDSRLTADSAQRAEFELITTLEQSSVLARCRDVVLHRVRWPVLEGVTAEGLLLIPKEVRAGVIAVPDADWTPEAFSGHARSADDPAPLAESVRAVRQLAEAGCLVVIPMLISRQDEFSGHPHVGFTNQPHREFLYRQAFEVGRHPIGYEVQKILAAVDLLSRQLALGQRLSDDKSSRERNQPLPIGVAGVGEGGLLALTAAALDPRIRVTWVRGYFSPRDELWREPIYRNVWGLLTEFGDAELAGLIAPRRLIIDPRPGVEIPGPPPVRDGRRNSAAPGRIQNPSASAVQEEFKQAAYRYQRTGHTAEIVLVPEASAAERPSALDAAVKAFAIGLQLDPGTIVKSVEPWQREPQRPQSSHSNAAPIEPSTKPTTHPADQAVHAREDRVREQRQFTELQQHVQTLLRRSHQVRDARWRPAIQTVEEWTRRRPALQALVHDELIGRLPQQRSPFRPRSRLILETDRYLGYEILLDVVEEISAAGILLLPKDLRAGEKRPVVVCQHGLEGVPRDTISREPGPFAYYKAFAEELVQRGYIVYAPQNPYRGGDRFRQLQRMSNPLGRSLFTYIIAQHEQTLDWLATLPQVDATRIAFYGLSYGGKTAMRVPPLIDRYALSICSGDFTDWPRTMASNEERFSYLFTSEYEVFEWNLAHLASYAELALLMSPRPFMVEEGHRDSGQPSEWVAGEFGKVRRHYDQLGLGDRAELEFFDGPHTIHGLGTFRFLERHLNWPAKR